MTGLGEAAARRAGFDVDVAYALAGHHAGYYPDAKPLQIKLIYDAATGRVLGARSRSFHSGWWVTSRAAVDSKPRDGPPRR
jgi:NADPH-dependent 2,4-dienoyl-CoA reductase/sulfur reductase-like enzyme